MTIRAIQWGVNWENILLLGELYNPVTDREYRDGSAFEQGPSGIETSWVTGRDYVLEAEIRWIPDTPGGTQTPVSGPVALQEFLTWARESNAFRFVPDSSLPLFYVENCYLVEPRRGFGQFVNIKRSVQLKIRNAAMDFHQALRGLMFEYAAGTDISASGLNGTFSRASVGTRIGVDGLLATDAANALRDRHYDGTPTVKTARLESTRTNVVLWNRDLTNAAWTKTNVTPNKTTTGIDGIANSASNLTATAGNGTCLQAITLGSSARYQSAYVRRILGGGAIQMTMDNGATWTAITAAIDAAYPAFVRVTIPTQTLANPTVGFRIVTNGDAIGVDYVQNENGTFASSPIATTTVAVTRSTDALSFPFPFKPQVLWLYVKLIEGGDILLSGTGVGLVSIGGDVNESVFVTVTSGQYQAVHRAGSDSTAFLAAAPTNGQTVELLLTVSATGAISARQSIDGAADTTAGPGAAAAFGSAFASAVLLLNDRGGVLGFGAFQQVKVGAGAGVTTIAQARVA